MAGAERLFLRSARDAEDVASALTTYQDQLPRSATNITAIISELFAVSAVLREIDNLADDRSYRRSFSRVQDDLNLVLPALHRTLETAFNMFTRVRIETYQRVWDELVNKMEIDEGFSFLGRLEVYHDFLRSQSELVQGREPQHDMRGLRQEIDRLLTAQEINDSRAQRRSIDGSASSTPRQRTSRSWSTRLETPISPVSTNGSWSDYLSSGRPLPTAPDPPQNMPYSPTNTSGSSQTLYSSHTSYSSDYNAPRGVLELIHWSQDIFDGEMPGTPFRRSFQLEDQSTCTGPSDAGALQHLANDGFIQTIELPFNREQLRVRLYWRPDDSRARILVIKNDSVGRESHHCTLLVHLKAIRDRTSIQLCRAHPSQEYSYTPWAKLNFFLYERMLLFYNTFVVMKRQDSREISRDDLLDELEMKIHELEIIEYSGTIKHGGSLHVLRIWRDRYSGVLRLEASARSGPMKDVPLWTAFITKYADDPDHIHYERGGIVSFIALKPPPYVFLAGYELPRNRAGEYFLQFKTDEDARAFVETWTGLRRSSGG